MSAIYKLPLVLDPQPEGGFTVTCPVLPELITEGDTPQEALENVSDALSALLEAYEFLEQIPNWSRGQTCEVSGNLAGLIPQMK